MKDSTVVVLVIAAVAAPIAYYLDRRAWRVRPRDQLVRLITDGIWIKWGAAIAELKRRGEDVSAYIPILLRTLLAESSMARESARICLKDHFPEVRPYLDKYTSTMPLDQARILLAPALERFGVQAPSLGA